MRSWLFLLLLMGLPFTGRAETTERQFLWENATAAMLHAREKNDFLNAATLHGELARRGVRNGVLYYNMGTALLAAEEYDAAVDAFLRAERYMGNDPDLRRNLRLAYTGRGHDGRAAPWHRFLLFWHYALPVGLRVSAAVFCFFGFWAGLIMARCRVQAGRTLAAWCAAVFVVLGSSAATSVMQESNSNVDIPTHQETEILE